MKQLKKTKLIRYLTASSILGLSLIGTMSTYANVDLTDDSASNISVSGENTPNEGKTKAFDDSQNSKWLTFNPTGWISYNFDRVVTINQYTVTSANDAQSRDPKDWKLQGSSDGTNWYELDSQRNQSFASRYAKNNYSVSNPQSAVYVRFNVSKNSGANILQLAELEFIGVEGGDTSEPLPVSDSGSLLKNEWKHYGPFGSTRKIIASTTGTGDTDLYMRKGDASTTKYYDCKSITASSNEACEMTGNDLYVSVHGYSNVTFNLEIKEEDDDNNAGWIQPNVDFIDMNPETEGAALLKRIISDPASYMAQRCIDVAKVLYSDPRESSRFHQLRFELRALNPQGNEFVAYKTGRDGSGEMTIAVSTTHLSNVYRNGGNSDSAIKDEIDGILFHEVTHGYNNSPLTEDGYGDGQGYWAYTEGLADGVRIGAGFHKTRRPDVNNSRKWLGGYTTSGFFLHYVKQKIDPNFIPKFNQAAKDMGNYTWSWNASFQRILGRDVENVWNEYKAFINNGGVLEY